jgi:hypothetical protein
MTRYCTHCGAPYEAETVNFCAMCGTSLKSAPVAAVVASPVAAHAASPMPAPKSASRWTIPHDHAQRVDPVVPVVADVVSSATASSSLADSQIEPFVDVTHAIAEDSPVLALPPRNLPPPVAAPAVAEPVGAVAVANDPRSSAPAVGAVPLAEPVAPPTPDAVENKSALRARWESSASFLVSTLVHTVAFIILSLIVIGPTEFSPPMLIVSAPAAAAEEFVVEEFQMIDTAEDLPTDVTSATELADLTSKFEVPDGPSEMDSSGEEDNAGNITLPDGLLSAVAGGGDRTLTGSSATFAQRLKQAKAKTGAVQVSLIWNNFNDLDLHVVAPSGELIFFQNRRSRCRGVLDVDRNAEGPTTNEPVENVYWPANRAPFGEYVVVVDHYRNHGDTDPTAFEVQVKVDGRTRKLTGIISRGDPAQAIHRFTRVKGGASDDDFYVE